MRLVRGRAAGNVTEEQLLFSIRQWISTTAVPDDRGDGSVGAFADWHSTC